MKGTQIVIVLSCGVEAVTSVIIGFSLIAFGVTVISTWAVSQAPLASQIVTQTVSKPAKPEVGV